MLKLSKIENVKLYTLLSKVIFYRYLRTFVDVNPKVAEQMRKNGTSITPEDYKKLQEENARLQTELKREKLRADFYEEMVSFGKEVFGIDLKKAGTKCLTTSTIFINKARSSQPKALNYKKNTTTAFVTVVPRLRNDCDNRLGTVVTIVMELM